MSKNPDDYVEKIKHLTYNTVIGYPLTPEFYMNIIRMNELTSVADTIRQEGVESALENSKREKEHAIEVQKEFPDTDSLEYNQLQELINVHTEAIEIMEN